MRGKITREDLGEITVLCVPAHMDLLLSEKLEQMCDELFDGGRNRIILDCTQLVFLNSVVIRILLNYHGAAIQRGGDLKFANASVHMEDIFQLAKLTEIFSWYKSVDEAIEAF